MIKEMAILTDVTKCIGCEKCVLACKGTYDLQPDRPWRWQTDPTGLSADRWTTLINRPGGHHVRQQCRHCKEPACVSVCPVGALQKTEEGAVIYDGSLCMGCRYCMMACPYGIPRYTWNEPVPFVRKCVMCHQKVTSGEQEEPSCTKACPVGATVFGERTALVEEGKQRIKDHPGKYIDRVWGEHEVGGTNVLYLSDINLDFLGLKPDLGTESLPSRTWGALKIVPGIFLGVGVVMSTTSWIVGRRMKIAAEQAEEAKRAEEAEQAKRAAQAEAAAKEDEEASAKTGAPEADKKDEA